MKLHQRKNIKALKKNAYKRKPTKENSQKKIDLQKMKILCTKEDVQKMKNQGGPCLGFFMYFDFSKFVMILYARNLTKFK